jgi:NADH-quinone oxidoreductase subunit J
MGAMVLAHRERLVPKPSQADLALRRMRDYADHGKHPGPLPAPGVFARHNAVDTPALLPDGTPVESSVSRVLVARGTVRSAPALADDIEVLTGQMGDGTQGGPRGPIEGDPTETRDENLHEIRPADDENKEQA